MGVDIRKLKQEQIKLAKKVKIKDDFEQVKHIGGVDQAFRENKIISVVTVLDYNTMELVEKKYAVLDVTMPYIPGYLSFRESPAIIEAFTKLEQRPDVLIVDANGILHPRRIGMASHVGIALDVPTIGVAKKLLLGEEKDGKIYVDKEVRAVKLDTKKKSNPVYVSPGHRISMNTAVKIIKHCVKPPHKLPEPVHLAHKIANKLKKGSEKE